MAGLKLFFIDLPLFRSYNPFLWLNQMPYQFTVGISMLARRNEN